MYTKHLSTAVLILVMLAGNTLPAAARKFPMPTNLSVYDNSLQEKIPALAKDVIVAYTATDKSSYFDNLFRLQLAAKNYAGAIRSIDSVQKYMAGKFPEAVAAVGIQFRCYALVKSGGRANHRSFPAIFQDTLMAVYQSLPQTAKRSAGNFFAADTTELRDNLNKQLGELARKAFISTEEAVSLIRKYNSWNVYRQIVKPGTAFLAMEDRKRYIIEDSVLIRMKDGAVLSAVVVRNKALTSPLPVILRYSIYADPTDISKEKRAADEGYVGVTVNTRGKYLSAAAIEPFEHDGEDAYEMLDWISKQPWCNGKIGMYGGSYLGFSQWSALKKMHPALKTIVPQVAVGIGIDYPSTGGIFMSYMLRWIHFVTNNKLTDDVTFNDAAHWEKLFEQWFRSGRSFRSMDSLDGSLNPVFQRWLQHPSYDSYWQSMVPYGAEFANIDIPILTTTGYYDADQLGALYYRAEHLKWNKQANHYLLIGPYDHSGAQGIPKAQVAGYTIDPVAQININDIVFQWFGYILKDGPMPAMLKDKVNYEVMDANEWRSAASLDALSNDSLIYYFGNKPEKDKYKLLPGKPLINGSVDVDNNYNDGKRAGSGQGNKDSKLNDHDLTFMSDKLDRDVVMSGPFGGEVRITINKKDVDLQASLYELRKDGTYLQLSNWLVRASYANDRTRRQLLVPGREEIIPIRNSCFTAKKIAKGSRIVLITGVNLSKEYQVNYGTGKDVSDETMADAQVPLHIQWSNQSYIKLPLEVKP